MTDGLWNGMRETEPAAVLAPDREDAADTAPGSAPEPAPRPWERLWCPFISGPAGSGDDRQIVLQHCLGAACPFWGRYNVNRVIGGTYHPDHYMAQTGCTVGRHEIHEGA